MQQSVATIVRREEYTEDLFGLWLQPHAAFTFEPGQYITVGLNGIERPYSIVSAPAEPLIELFIERVAPEHGGTLTPLLHARRPGDTVTIRPRPKGRFSLRAGAVHHVMAATVTGVAPYVSMIRQFLRDRAGDTVRVGTSWFFVLHGASYQDEFVYDRELRGTSEAHPSSIQYVSSVSRPADARNIGWTGPVGRVNVILEDYLARWSLPKTGTVIYLCGNPGMIDDAKARLGPQGWTLAEEQYWTSLSDRV